MPNQQATGTGPVGITPATAMCYVQQSNQSGAVQVRNHEKDERHEKQEKGFEKMAGLIIYILFFRVFRGSFFVVRLFEFRS